MSENNRRVPTLIFNILFALACAAAIVMYFLAPIWRLDLKTQIPNETVQEMMGERAEGLDMDEVLGKENVTISLELFLDSFDLALAVVQWNAGPMVEKMVDENVDAVIGQLSGDINAIAKAVTQQDTRETVKSQVKNQIRDYFVSAGDDKTDEEIDAVLSDAGITDAFIEEQADKLVENVFANGSTVDAVCDEAVEIAADVIAQLKDHDPEQFADLELTEEIETQIRESVASSVSDYADENGNIDVNEAINAMLIDGLQSLRQEGGTDGTTDDEQNTPEDDTTPMPDPSSPVTDPEDSEAEPAAFYAAAESGEEMSASDEQLREEVRSYLLDTIRSQPLLSDAILPFIFLGLGVLFAISLLSWVYLLVKIICKTFMDNCYVKIKAPVIFGWFLFLFLMLLPNLALTYLPTLFASSLPASVLDIFAAFAGTTFFSSAMYAAIAAAALIVLWIPYRIICKPKND